MIDAQDKEILLDKERLEEEKKKTEREYSEHQKYLDDWRDVLRLPAGRRIVWDLLGAMGYQKDMFSTDPLIMAANCGKYQLILPLLKDIEEAIPGILFKTSNEIRSLQSSNK